MLQTFFGGDDCISSAGVSLFVPGFGNRVGLSDWPLANRLAASCSLNFCDILTLSQSQSRYKQISKHKSRDNM